MTSILKWAKTTLQRGPLPMLGFPQSGFEVIKPSKILEEERFAEFKKGHYYAVNIGDVLVSKYQVVGKLGFGTTSTVWLARDLEGHRYVTLKVYTMDGTGQGEIRTYKALSRGDISHPGYAPSYVGELSTFNNRSPEHRLSEHLLKSGIKQIFLALDYLHSECQLVHTDIKGDNILQELEEMSILDKFTDSEIEDPSAYYQPVYASRRFELPQNFGRAVLSDFGSAVRGNEKRNHDAQPTIYRSPEVMLKIEWSYPIDIWNVGTMIWDLFEGKDMFIGMDPDGKGYSTRAHLAEMIGILGPP
ncbi:hypothetical protein N7463_003431 [Penicillium fimorum]|uniref:non-specific serine/threonine protein kinase n=1 Tax=Penicillium fimorum TaxID=1882269 RepID=A0A9W9Y0W9_9EURO|nr:hypothetical protein N7463_003431 [Penicillium fimorum]